MCFFPAETEPHEGKRKVESLWPIFRLHHQRSRYIFDLFYKRKAISRGLVTFLCTYAHIRNINNVVSVGFKERMQQFHLGTVSVFVSLPILRYCDALWYFNQYLSFSACVWLMTELYEYCIKEGYADKNLIAKWKKQGYENLCCLRCIQTRDTNFGTNCICRVPKSKLEVVSLALHCY